MRKCEGVAWWLLLFFVLPLTLLTCGILYVLDKDKAEALSSTLGKWKSVFCFCCFPCRSFVAVVVLSGNVR